MIQQITHNIIAQDITKLGAGLQQFIETIYPAIKNDPLGTLSFFVEHLPDGQYLKREVKSNALLTSYISFMLNKEQALFRN
jgi:hypothetical protein